MSNSPTYAYIKWAYSLEFTPGQRVRHTETNNSGVVEAEDFGMSHYVQVRFDGNEFELPCHPQALEVLP